jgi:hypothetical protein
LKFLFVIWQLKQTEHCFKGFSVLLIKGTKSSEFLLYDFDYNKFCQNQEYFQNFLLNHILCVFVYWNIDLFFLYTYICYLKKCFHNLVKYSEACLKLNKTESCIDRTINKVPMLEILCKLNLFKLNTCPFWTQKLI